MAKTGVLLPILMAGFTSVGSMADFREICGKPSVIGPFAGPQLIGSENKKGVDAAIELMTAGETDDTKRKAEVQRLRESVRQNEGLFVSSPYVLDPVAREEKIGKICVVFGFGGVAYVIHQTQKNNPSGVKSALEVSDNKCFDYVRTIKRD